MAGMPSRCQVMLCQTRHTALAHGHYVLGTGGVPSPTLSPTDPGSGQEAAWPARSSPLAYSLASGPYAPRLHSGRGAQGQ